MIDAYDNCPHVANLAHLDALGDDAGVDDLVITRAP